MISGAVTVSICAILFGFAALLLILLTCIPTGDAVVAIFLCEDGADELFEAPFNPSNVIHLATGYFSHYKVLSVRPLVLFYARFF